MPHIHHAFTKDRGRVYLMQTMRHASTLLLALLATAAGGAPAGAQSAPDRPIVYVVVVDGLDGDEVDQGTAPYLRGLLDGTGASATDFRASRSVIPAETNPNHAAMMTGAYPGTSGISANAFALYAPLANEDSCEMTGPVDFSKAPTATSGEHPLCMTAETVFAAIKRQGNPDGLVSAAILGKPKLGRIFAQRTVDPQRRDVDYLWSPCSSGADDDEYCGDAPTNPLTGYALSDTVVMDEVIRTATQGVPAPGGAVRRPDLTFVNLPQVDSIGHATGRGALYQSAIRTADDEIRRLVETLRARGEWARTVLIVTSDHSMDSTPSKISMRTTLTDAGIPEDQFVVVQNGSIDYVYLADRTSPTRFELLARMRAAALQTGGVTEALYREDNPADGGAANTLGAVHPGWRSVGERTGDLVVVSGEGTAFSEGTLGNPLPGNHGGPQTRDNFLAVIGGGAHVRDQTLTGNEILPGFDDTRENREQAENVDIASTVLGLFGLSPARNNQGRFLANAFDRGALAGAGRPTVRPEPAVDATRRAKGGCSYRLSWSPGAGRFDVQARRRQGRRWWAVKRNVRASAARVKGPAGLRFRVRLRAAGGTPGPWVATPRACRGS